MDPSVHREIIVAGYPIPSDVSMVCQLRKSVESLNPEQFPVFDDD